MRHTQALVQGVIATISGLPDGVIGVEVVGVFAVDDFRDTVQPLVEQVSAAGSEIRLVVHLGQEFAGFGGGPWADLTSSLVKMPFRRGAMVTDHVGLTTGLNLLKWKLAGDVRTFRNDEFDLAVEWVSS